MNRAVAVGRAGSPEDGLALVEALAAYDRAIALAEDDAERGFLARRRSAVGGNTD